jgi:hypothetical protein
MQGNSRKWCSAKQTTGINVHEPNVREATWYKVGWTEEDQSLWDLTYMKLPGASVADLNPEPYVLMDPDPLVRGMDPAPAPDPSIINQK